MRIRKKRLTLWLSLVSIACLGVTVFIPDWYVIVKGVVNGEAFYRGRPSSYWSKKINSHQLDFTWGDEMYYVDDIGFYHRLPDWMRDKLGKVGLRWEDGVVVPKDKEHAELIKLLIDLMNDDRPRVRYVAARALGIYRPVNMEVIIALTKGLSDGDVEVRAQSASSLENIAHFNREYEQTVEQILREKKWVGSLFRIADRPFFRWLL